MRWIILSFLIGCTVSLTAQVGVNSDGSFPDGSAMLDVKSTGRGFLPPRLTTLQRDAVQAPAKGLLIFNNDCEDIQIFNGTSWLPIGNVGLLATPGPISGSTGPCQGSSGNVYTIDPVPGATGYHWLVPNGSVITSGKGTRSITLLTGSTAGSISVSAFNNCYRSAVQSINMTPVAVVQPTISIQAVSLQVCTGSVVNLTSVVSNGGAIPGYQWQLNGVNINGATSSGYSFIPADGDEITCLVTSVASCVSGNPAISNSLVFSVNPCASCGGSVTVNHVIGFVAPVTKTVSYGTVSFIAGEPGKCWITHNLGASGPAVGVNDNTEAAAGWYWQFNLKQGFMHDGTNRTPSTEWISNNYSTSNWLAEQDPCAIELGTPWRIPTSTEWSNVHNMNGWTNWIGPWTSPLALHAAGALNSIGFLINRGAYGYYWSSDNFSLNSSYALSFSSEHSNVYPYSTDGGFPLRCIKQ